MTPQLVEAIRLLQLSRVELVDEIRRELFEGAGTGGLDVPVVASRDGALVCAFCFIAEQRALRVFAGFRGHICDECVRATVSLFASTHGAHGPHV